MKSIFFLSLSLLILFSEESAAQYDYAFLGYNYVSFTRGDFPYACSWKPQEFDSVEAITEVAITDTNPFEGNGSLEIEVCLDADSSHLRNGETFVDLRNFIPLGSPPDCLNAPINMFNVTISMQVYCPDSLQGPDSMPNGFQIFVKDHQWRSFYGSWHNITDGLPNGWHEITVTISNMQAPGGWMEPGFDPTQIIAIGFKVGINEQQTDFQFKSKIWLDLVTCYEPEIVKYDFNNLNNAIEQLATTGANTTALVVTWYQADTNATEIAANELLTQTDTEIIATIQALHNQGLKVMLKPHVDVDDGSWRGYIAPSDVNAWFDSYTDFILHYAQIADDHDVELLCIGTELANLQKLYAEHWNAAIDSIETIFEDTLVYASNWDDYGTVVFWDRVDIAGVDAYFPLDTMNPDPSMEGLLNSWQPRISALENWQIELGLPVLFTEIGYASRDSAAADPWAGCDFYNPCSHEVNCLLQAHLYKAALLAFRDKDWFKGMLFWNWDPVADAGGCCNRHFTPQSKPAEMIFNHLIPQAINDTIYLSCQDNSFQIPVTENDIGNVITIGVKIDGLPLEMVVDSINATTIFLSGIMESPFQFSYYIEDFLGCKDSADIIVELQDFMIWYLDADNDDYGNPAVDSLACSQPVDFASNPDDCDDTNVEIHPNVMEICDGLDNNCNGLSDEDFPNEDGDNYGDPCDNCLTVFNNNQFDSDNDGIGDLCDPDFCQCDDLLFDVSKGFAADSIDENLYSLIPLQLTANCDSVLWTWGDGTETVASAKDTVFHQFNSDSAAIVVCMQVYRNPPFGFSCSEIFCDTLWEIMPPVSVSELPTVQVLLYPNPASDWIRIKLPFDFPFLKKEDLLIKDIFGRTSWSNPMAEEKEFIIPLNQLASGLYILVWYQQGKPVFSEKFVKQ